MEGIGKAEESVRLSAVLCLLLCPFASAQTQALNYSSAIIQRDHLLFIDKAVVDCPADPAHPTDLIAFVHDVGNSIMINCEPRDALVTMKVVQSAVDLTQQIRDQQWQAKIDELTAKLAKLEGQSAKK